MHDIFRRFRDVGIIPVIVMEHEEHAEKLADILCDNGLPCAEVTFRTEAAAKVIAAMVKHRPDMLVGAGTVLTVEEVDLAVASGAQFIVSPGLNPTVVQYCQEQNIPMAPGTQTPSEMEQAIGLGVDFVKFFPAEQSGGLNMIKAVAAPYGQLSFMPTGGINADNVQPYLQNDRIVACGGSWMVKESLMEAGNWKKIAKLVQEAADIVRKARGKDNLNKHLLAS